MTLDELRSMGATERAEVLGKLAKSDPAALAKLVEVLRKLDDAHNRRKFYRMFPDEGPFRRELYFHHMQFYADGAWAKFRAFIGGNGTGKTEGGGFELACHLTGRYPAWWQGKRFDHPIVAWVGGDTTKTCRDIIQKKLLGAADYKDSEVGTGIIPADCIGKVNPSNQLTGLVDYVRVKHESGQWSTLFLKSYDQGRDAWQGTEIHVIWLDEQAPTPIFEECAARFRGESSGGRMFLTFTGLKGATDVALMFLPELTTGTTLEDMRKASRARVVCPMDDVPHLSKQDIADILGSTTGAVRETRRTGIPYTASGRIYKVDEKVFVVEPFLAPKYWPRVYGADFGFGSEEKGAGTAVVWGAFDRESDTIYIYAEYFAAEMPRAVHVDAIKNRGAWIPGVGDYAGKTDDGTATLRAYRELGLDIEPANKSVQVGIDTVNERLTQGRLKVFSSCTRWLGEYRLYSYADNGTIKKERDHLMDATRYLVMSGVQRARIQAPQKVITMAEETFGL